MNFDRLRERVAECTEVRGRVPTLVAVDFSETSDVLDVVREVNRPGATRPRRALASQVRPPVGARPT